MTRLRGRLLEVNLVISMHEVFGRCMKVLVYVGVLEKCWKSVLNSLKGQFCVVASRVL